MTDKELEEYDTWVEEHYDELRCEYKEWLMEECGYSRLTAENTDDGWDEFVLDAYKNR